MVKDSLAYLKNNQMAKNEMGMGKYSLRYHTHTKFQGFMQEK